MQHLLSEGAHANAMSFASSAWPDAAPAPWAEAAPKLHLRLAQRHPPKSQTKWLTEGLAHKQSAAQTDRVSEPERFWAAAAAAERKHLACSALPASASNLAS